MFYDKLFSSLDFTLPRAATGRRGFPKEAMVCAFIVMKCEGFSQITDLMDYLDNNRLIAHYCGFNIMVFAPLRCPKLFRFPFACLRAVPSACFAHLFALYYIWNWPPLQVLGRLPEKRQQKTASGWGLRRFLCIPLN